MCNETKVNTNNTNSSRTDENKFDPHLGDYAGSFLIPHGRIDLARGAVYDHLAMRSLQLASLLRLMQGEGQVPEVSRLGDRSQHSLLWLAQQLADEIDDSLPFVQEIAPQPPQASTP